MGSRRVLAAGSLLVLLGIAAIGVTLAGGLLGGDGGGLRVNWVSDTARETEGNHHAVAAATVDGRDLVFVPISGEADTGQCDLAALNATTGETVWAYPIPAADCTIHSVADPLVTDFDGDGLMEVLAATTQEAVFGLSARSGEVEFRHAIGSYGYTQPLVTDLTGDQTPEIIAVDIRGTVSVLRPDGSTVWRRELDTYTWGQPRVADFDGDGAPELVVGTGGGGRLTQFEADGETRWNLSRPFGTSITWMTIADTDGDRATEIVTATIGGLVSVIDGRTGGVQWREDLGAYAAVHAVGDGDDDGALEIYAVAKDGVLRALAADTGRVEWETTLTEADVQMTPPPTLGDVDGDGAPELVAVTNDGSVQVIAPKTGDVLYRYGRSVPVYVHPTVADLDGDGAAEIYVMYGDGTVVKLSVP